MITPDGFMRMLAQLDEGAPRAMTDTDELTRLRDQVTFLRDAVNSLKDRASTAEAERDAAIKAADDLRLMNEVFEKAGRAMQAERDAARRERDAAMMRAARHVPHPRCRPPAALTPDTDRLAKVREALETIRDNMHLMATGKSSRIGHTERVAIAALALLDGEAAE